MLRHHVTFTLSHTLFRHRYDALTALTASTPVPGPRHSEVLQHGTVLQFRHFVTLNPVTHDGTGTDSFRIDTPTMENDHNNQIGGQPRLMAAGGADSPARGHSTPRPMFWNLPPGWRSPLRLHSSLACVGPSLGPHSRRRPLPDASPWWEPAPKPLVAWFSARAPCDGSSIPQVVARRNRHGARRFSRHVADGGGPVSGTALPRCVLGRMVWVRRRSARGSQAGNDSRIGAFITRFPGSCPRGTQHRYSSPGHPVH